MRSRRKTCPWRESPFFVCAWPPSVQTSCLTVILLYLVSSAVAVPSPPYMVRLPPHQLLYRISSEKQEIRPVVLDCEAKGDPQPEYRWTKNGEDFVVSGSDDRIGQEPGKGTLTIHRPKDIDEGLYQCRAENGYGISLSNTILLKRAGLDSFRTENNQEELVVDEGQQLTLKCNAPSGNPKPNLFWILQSTNGEMRTVNGSRISVDPEGDLHFSNITLDDASGDQFYACSAFSSVLREYKTSQLTKLIVRPSTTAVPNKVAPVCQYTSPNHVEGLRGQDVDISCIYGGIPLPEIRWERKGASLPPRRHSVLEFGKVLRLKRLQFEDQGTYECTAKNGVGQVRTHAFTLTIDSEPYWITAPENAQKDEGEDHTFGCVAGGVPDPHIQWFVNGTLFENLQSNPRRFFNGTHITITAVQKDIDTDNYQCSASNKHGYIFADVYMNVLALPAEIIEPPPEITETVETSKATIRCRVFGAPKPTVSWEKDGATINMRSSEGNRYQQHKDGDLIIDPAEFRDDGVYTCKAENRFGAVKQSGNLAVKRKTVITAPPEDVERRAGDSATFRCTAVPDPALETRIEWLRDGEPIQLGQNGRIFQNNDNSLTISQAKEEHSGVYTCVARTRLDSTEAQATLVVRDVPNPPINVKVQCSPAARHAVVSWEPNGDSREPIQEFIIQYSTSFEPGEWHDKKDGIPGTHLSSDVELSPWVNYTFRVRARNSIGLSNESVPSQEVCSTTPDVPYKNPDNVQGKGDQPTNLVITWTPMPQIDHNGPGFHYMVKWVPAKSDSNAQVVEQTQPVTDWRLGTLTVTNVPEYTPYDVAVVAVNNLGESRAANDPPIRGFSGENIPTEAPKDFYLVENIDGKKAMVEWKPVAADSIHGDFKGYKIQVTPKGEEDKPPREIRVGPNASNALVDVLKPASSNKVVVMPYNGQYDGPKSSELTIETRAAPSGRVADLRAYPMGRGAIFMEWKPPTEPNGDLSFYDAEIYKVDGLAVSSDPIREPTIIDDLSHPSVKLSGLEPDTKYRIKLFANNQAGRGEPGIVEAATESNRSSEALALLPPPGEPQFKLAGKTNDSIIVAWQPQDAASKGHRTGEHFYVEHRRDGEGDWVKGEPVLDGLSTNITGLEPGTTYEIRVVAVEGDQEVRGPIQKETTDGVRVGVAGSPMEWATSGWFIGVMCVLALIVLMALIFCIVCRSKRGGKYAVNEGDRSRKPPSYDYEKAPTTIPQGIVNPNSLAKIRPSDTGNGDENASIISKEGGSEADSMEEYGDPDQPKMFTEDGSWIGQYASNTVRSNDAVVTTTVAQHPTGSTFV